MEWLFGQLRPGRPDQADGMQTTDRLGADREHGRHGVFVAYARQRDPLQSVPETAVRIRLASRRQRALDRRHMVKSQWLFFTTSRLSR